MLGKERHPEFLHHRPIATQRRRQHRGLRLPANERREGLVQALHERLMLLVAAIVGRQALGAHQHGLGIAGQMAQLAPGQLQQRAAGQQGAALLAQVLAGRFEGRAVALRDALAVGHALQGQFEDRHGLHSEARRRARHALPGPVEGAFIATGRVGIVIDIGGAEGQGRQQLVEQGFPTQAERHQVQQRRLVPQQATAQIAKQGFGIQHQQSGHTQAMARPGLARIIAQGEVHAVAAVEQRRVGEDLHAGLAKAMLRRQRREFPAGQPRLPVFDAGARRALAIALHQLLSIAAVRQQAAALVHKANVHPVIIRHLDRLPHLGVDARPAELVQRRAQDGGQGLIARRHLRQGAIHPIGRRCQALAQRFGQGLDQRDALLAQESRHQPVRTIARQAIEQGHRHGNGHAVLFPARRKSIAQTIVLSVPAQPVGEALGERSRVAGQQLPALKAQGGVAPWVSFEPVGQRGRVGERCGQALVVEAKQRVFVDQQIAPAQARLQVLHLALHAQVVLQERRRARPAPAQQALADQQGPAQLGVQRGVGHADPVGEREPEQRGAAPGDYPPLGRLPARFAVVVLEQRGVDVQRPARVDARRRSRVHLPGLDDLAGEQPLRRLAVEV